MYEEWKEEGSLMCQHIQEAVMWTTNAQQEPGVCSKAFRSKAIDLYTSYLLEVAYMYYTAHTTYIASQSHMLSFMS